MIRVFVILFVILEHSRSAVVPKPRGYHMPEIGPPILERVNQDPGICGRRDVTHEPPKSLLYQPLLKIVGGSTVPYGSYPWTAHVEALSYEGFKHACGGTIVSDTHIVTAAHCIHGLSQREVRVKVGDSDSRTQDPSEKIYEIENWKIHPHFQTGGLHNNDIAVIKLKRFQGKGIQFNQHVSAACLPSEKTQYKPGIKCYVSGWGLLHNDAFYPSDTIRAATVPLVADDICRSKNIIGPKRIHPGMMCAGYLEGGIDACNGDSGGPLVCKVDGRHTLLGVVSWGVECAQKTKPGVYSNVQFYLNFIEEAMKML